MLQSLLLVSHEISEIVWIRFQHGAESFCHAAAILRGTEAVSELTRAFYNAALSIVFFPLDFVSGDLALTGV